MLKNVLGKEKDAEKDPLEAENIKERMKIQEKAQRKGKKRRKHPQGKITAADALSQFYYPPVAAVSVSYPKSAVRSECLINGELKGFGQLHPRSQGVETLGKLDDSSKTQLPLSPLEAIFLLH
eukprot:Gb_09333 [translate_table: standard]